MIFGQSSFVELYSSARLSLAPPAAHFLCAGTSGKTGGCNSLPLLPRLGSKATLQVSAVTAAASTPFRFSVYADGPRPVKSCFHSVAAETTPAAQGYLLVYELELLHRHALEFAEAVESPPVLAAKQGVVCRNHRRPDSPLPLSIEV